MGWGQDVCTPLCTHLCLRQELGQDFPLGFCVQILIEHRKLILQTLYIHSQLVLSIFVIGAQHTSSIKGYPRNLSLRENNLEYFGSRKIYKGKV